MVFHADSESDLKTTPNQVKNQILSKILFLWYFDRKFPLRWVQKAPLGPTGGPTGPNGPTHGFPWEPPGDPNGIPHGVPSLPLGRFKVEVP